MKPITPFDSFPSFGNGGSRSAPGDAKYALGFVPADTFPAEWANYFFHGATKGVSDLNSAVTSLWNEMGSVLSNYNITPDATDNDQLLECLTKLKAEAALAAHPVGSLYWTSVNENPATTFGGGTWEQIKDKFILAAGDTYSQGATGGSATVTLTESQMPVHRHSFTPSGSVSSTFTGSAVNTDSKGGHSHTTNTLTNSSGTAITQTGVNNRSHHHALPKFYDNNTGGGQWHFDSLKNSVAGDITYITDNESQNHTHNFEHKHGTDTQGAHTHSVTAAGSVSSSFSGTTGNTGNAGGSSGTTQAHDNMPPYIVQYCWRRTA